MLCCSSTAPGIQTLQTLHKKKLTNTSQNYAEDAPLVEFMYLVFTRMPGESHRRRLGSVLLYLCYVFRALINSLVLLCVDSKLY